ncbi:MAG: cytochrome c family protein [Ignavibacteriae bacterium]|nr:cytochrome c family protein [Ignavibacteriota bacterium]
MCHKKADQGEQLKIWEESAHANAFKTLQTEAADKIAGGKAAEDPKCLKCHVSGHGVDASLLSSKFSIEDGVQCETCHGAGSAYKSKKIMEDHAKSVAAGMTAYADEAAIEKQCRSCHNEESPNFKGFNFEEMWAKIKHPVPAKG